jgi:type VI secretion system secreted protein VgrG
MTAHLGSVVMGAMTVMIGDVGGGGGGAAAGAMGAASAAARTMSAAKAAGAAFVETDCAKKTVVAALGDHPALRQPPKDKKDWIEIELVDDAGAPIAHERYRIVAPDGTPYEGWTDGNGIARVEGLDPGQCEITLPDLDNKSWK